MSFSGSVRLPARIGDTRQQQCLLDGDEGFHAVAVTPSRQDPGRLRAALLQSFRSRDERYARQRITPTVLGSSTADGKPAGNRHDRVEQVIGSSRAASRSLFPSATGRMMVSPFTFYRGTANIMAADLASTPVTGLHAQLCGDAHLSISVGFATPERNLVLDRTISTRLSRAWEWD